MFEKRIGSESFVEVFHRVRLFAERSEEMFQIFDRHFNRQPQGRETILFGEYKMARSLWSRAMKEHLSGFVSLRNKIINERVSFRRNIFTSLDASLKLKLRMIELKANVENFEDEYLDLYRQKVRKLVKNLSVSYRRIQLEEKLSLSNKDNEKIQELKSRALNQRESETRERL